MAFSISDVQGMLHEKLAGVFSSDIDLAPRAIVAINNFSNWFHSSDIPFFRSYTDHSAAHSMDVFRSGVDFIAEEAYQVVTSKDLSYFLVACFCHDAGMHLTEKQFMLLISKENKKVLSSIDNDPWPQLWKQFCSKALRFNARKLNSLFGDNEPLTLPPRNIIDYTERHRILIGEFIRTNHPRLAHDLVLGLDEHLGMSSLLSGFSFEEKDLIGLIARSHGFALRHYFPYIKSNYDLKDYNKLHIVFIMCMLRLSDFAQMQAYRAPALRQKIHQIASPISQKEWRVHNCIKNLHFSHDDPDALFVKALPESVEDFQKAKEWIEGLQEEIDKCWAVLGELYGRQISNNLAFLRLTLRRVRSSLFDEEKSFKFLPEKIQFRVAEAEMLSLLLAPLYGDHPGYGVRELIQNACDACREARALKIIDAASSVLPSVVISIREEQGKAFFSIRDCGSGMDESIIRDYYLNAGASFRSSSLWRETFIDAAGKPSIVKSGRFGVGALAAFMIGPKISLKTRYYKAPASGGLRFDARLHDELIEITRFSKAEIGTTIEIEVAEENISEMFQFFGKIGEYFQSEQDLQVQARSTQEGVDKSANLNAKSESLFLLDSSTYGSVAVCRGQSLDDRKHIPDFVNGIAITDYDDRHENRRIIDIGSFSYPPEYLFDWRDRSRIRELSVSMQDVGAHAPINLARTGYTSSDKQLSELLADKAFSDLLQFAGDILENHKPVTASSILLLDQSVFSFFQDGICPLDAFAMQSANIEHIACLASHHIDKRSTLKSVENVAFCFGRGLHETTSRTEFFKTIRSIRDRNHGFDKAYCIMRTQYLKDTLQLANIPSWYVECVESAEKLDNDDARILIFGQDKSDISAKLVEIRQRVGDASVFCISSKNWRPMFWWREAEPEAPSLICSRWIEKFRADGCLLRSRG